MTHSQKKILTGRMPFFKMDLISFCHFKHGNFKINILYLDTSKTIDWGDKEGQHSPKINLLNEPP